MSEVKDPRIKLFGKTIQLPETVAAAVEIVGILRCEPAGNKSPNRDSPSSSNSVRKDGCSSTNPEARELDKGDEMNEEDLNAAIETDSQAVQTSKTEEEQTEKTLKKPDRILPCPRCNSMDTKFCYYNNYNTNQPRHFCKNCQRYWTAGGTMRNVPVGAGRRKNKASVAQFRHMAVSDSSRVDLPNGFHHPLGLNSNGTVLTFSSSDAPLCESMVSSLYIADKTIKRSSSNGFHQAGEQRSLVSHGRKEYGDDKSTETSVGSSKEMIGDKGPQQPIPNSHPYLGPMPYPWHPVHWSSPISSPTIAYAASYPMMPFYPTPPPYLSYSVPWIISPAPAMPPTSGPLSPTLGKHSRDDNNIQNPANSAEETEKHNTSEKLFWVPKTLRIDDPGEATKSSSIWATLGIKKDGVDSFGGNRSLFKAFQSQSKDKETQGQETSPVLHANPAALSRSLSFHERS